MFIDIQHSLAAKARAEIEERCCCLGAAAPRGVVPSFVPEGRLATEWWTLGELTAEGNDRGRVAPGARSTALRLRVRIVSHCHATCGGGIRGVGFD